MLLAEKQQLEQEYIKEIQGVTGTKKYGNGSASQAISNRLNTLKKELDLRELQYQRTKVIFEKELVSKKVLFETSKLNTSTLNRIDGGFLQKIIAQDQITNQNLIVKYVLWLLRTLILVLECAPILGKVFSKPSQYDFEEALEINKIKYEYEEKLLKLKKIDLENKVLRHFVWVSKLKSFPIK